MFIYNIKINGGKTFKIIFIFFILLMVIILGIVFYKVFSGAKNYYKLLDENSFNGKELSPKDYTNLLKKVHEDIDTYIGKKIKFTGYVYRVLDLSPTQFVLARDMIINSRSQTVVVGFLCECDNAKDFEEGSWVNICGEITKGDYHGDMPILKITEINQVDCPSDEYVYPPDESYIPTSAF